MTSFRTSIMSITPSDIEAGTAPDGNAPTSSSHLTKWVEWRSLSRLDDRARVLRYAFRRVPGGQQNQRLEELTPHIRTQPLARLAGRDGLVEFMSARAPVQIATPYKVSLTKFSPQSTSSAMPGEAPPPHDHCRPCLGMQVMYSLFRSELSRYCLT